MLSSFNRENFYDILNSYTAAQLELMTKEYPFQHELHLLLAKKYQLEKNPAFDEQLQLAAIYAQDRELFFTLFNEAVPELPEIRDELYEAASAGLEKSMVAQELATVDVLHVQEIDREKPSHVIEEVAFSVAQNEQEVEVGDALEHTFDEWLRLYKPAEVAINNADVIAPPVELPEAGDELNRLILENSSVDLLHELVKEETHYSKGLDEFIEQQIRKKKHVEPKKSSSESEIDAGMVTETLARLYEMQKKYTRAIKSYQLLSLKYPEKSDLFAARINYLKNLT